jgi:hypothetical protein
MQSPSTAELSALNQASTSLWLATLSLMTAFMHQPAPAHRYLLARRIARNFATLRAQEECFPAATRTKFAELEQRWELKAQRLSPNATATPQGGVLTRLQRLLVR